MAAEAKAMAKAYPNKVFLSFDLSNAFGALRRDKMLAALREQCPQLYPLVYTMWGNSTEAWLPGEDGPTKAYSDRGIWQGESLSPALFALAMSRALKELELNTRNKHGITIITRAYLDDVLIIVEAEHAEWVVNEFSRIMASYGWILNHTKSQSYIPRDCDIHSQQLALRNWGGVTETRMGLKLLGKTIEDGVGLYLGPASWVARGAKERAAKTKKLCQALRDWMDDPDDSEHTAHISWLIIRHCATAALAFDMRILGKEHVLMAAQEVDAEILKTLAKILRHDASTPIPERATKQLYLPAWLGGGGIRRQEDLIDCLFVSAAMQIWPIIAA